MAGKIKIGKTYTNVFDMLRGEYPENPEFADAAKEAYDRQKIGNLLFMTRTKMGLTQQQVAERMGVSQSTVAKMEDRGDLLRFSDLVSYMKAINHSIFLQVTDNKLTLAEVLRWHLECVVGIMKELERVAADDPDIRDGVHIHFVQEVGRMLADVLPRWSGTMSRLMVAANDNQSEPGTVHVELQSAPGLVLQQ